jgi:hypothetical protein
VIRPSLTPDSLTQAVEFEEQCWRNGLATYPSMARAAHALAGLLEWQRLQG